MSGDQPISPIPARDFTRMDQASSYRAVVGLSTSYSGMLVSAEETGRMLRRVYGPDRIPGTESRRRSQMGEAKTCGMTGCTQPARSCGWCFDHCNVIHRHGSCSVEGCERPHVGHGLCGAHLERRRRWGDPLGTPPPKPPKPVPPTAEMKAEMTQALARAHKEVGE